MSKLPPYEEWDEQWSDGLELPDADKAWADMKVRLDAEDRKRRFGFLLPVLPCAGWTLVGLVAIGAATWLLWPSGSGGKADKTGAPGLEQPAAISHGTPSATEQHSVSGNDAGSEGTSVTSTKAETPAATGNGTLKNNTSATGTPAATPAKAVATPTGSTPTTGAGTAASGTSEKRTNTPATTRPLNPEPHIAVRNTQVPAMAVRKAKTPAPVSSVAKKTKQSVQKTGTWKTTTPVAAGDPQTNTTPASPAAISDSPATPTQQNNSITTVTKTPAPDSSALVKTPLPDSATAKTPAPDSNATAAVPDPLPKKKGVKGWTFSAGVALHQGFAIGRQQSWNKNYQGSGNPLSEHLPSLWVRAEKGRWSLQAEARFHAPQAVEGSTFSQRTVWDTGGHMVLTDRRVLRKAWYHQYTGTVSYRVVPHLTLGAGMQWSLLHQAYAERLLIWTDYYGNELRTDKLQQQIPGFRDSFLYKSQWQVLLQTEYSWRRWSLGLRYRADLEPYLRYTRPNGTVVTRQNDAFEAILRFRIWQSKGRKK